MKLAKRIVSFLLMLTLTFGLCPGGGWVGVFSANADDATAPDSAQTEEAQIDQSTGESVAVSDEPAVPAPDAAQSIGLTVPAGEAPPDSVAKITRNNQEIGTYSTLQAALNAALAGDTVTLLKNITVSGEGIQGNDPAIWLGGGVTLNGGGHTITAGADFRNEVHVVGAWGTKDDPVHDVKIQNLTIVGNDTTKHCLNLHYATNAVVENVTLKNSATAGMVVNASSATISGLTTQGNVWGGINVDRAQNHEGVEPKLTITGTNAINEPSKIWSDQPLADAGKFVMDDTNLWTATEKTVSGKNKTFWIDSNGSIGAQASAPEITAPADATDAEKQVVNELQGQDKEVFDKVPAGLAAAFKPAQGQQGIDLILYLKIELKALVAVAQNPAKTTLTYSVSPFIKQAGVPDAPVANDQLKGTPIMFRLPVPTSIAVGNQAKVLHNDTNGNLKATHWPTVKADSPCVNGETTHAHYIDVTVTGFSDFIVAFNETKPAAPSTPSSSKPAAAAEQGFDWLNVLAQIQALGGSGKLSVNIEKETSVPHYIWQAIYGKGIALTFKNADGSVSFNGIQLKKAGFDPDNSQLLANMAGLTTAALGGSDVVVTVSDDDKKADSTKESKPVSKPADKDEPAQADSAPEKADDSAPSYEAAAQSKYGTSIWFWVLLAAAVVAVAVLLWFFVSRHKDEQE